MTAPPDRIYLNTAGDYDAAQGQPDGVTWCEHAQDDDDTCYIRLDLHTDAIAAAEARGREQGLREAAELVLEWQGRMTLGSGVANAIHDETLTRIHTRILDLIPARRWGRKARGLKSRE